MSEIKADLGAESLITDFSLDDSVTIKLSELADLARKGPDSPLTVKDLDDAVIASSYPYDEIDHLKPYFDDYNRNALETSWDFVMFFQGLLGEDIHVEFSSPFIRKLPSLIIKEFTKDFLVGIINEYDKRNFSPDIITQIRCSDLEESNVYSVYSVWHTVARFLETGAISIEDLASKLSYTKEEIAEKVEQYTYVKK